MILPDTQHVSLRNVILWIAYGDAEPPNDYAGNELWFSKEKEIKDARSAAWSALENGTLEASAIGPDRAPTLIGKHEWQYLIGHSMPAYIEGRKRQDALYVISTFTPSIGGVPAGNPRFTNVTVPRAAI